MSRRALEYVLSPSADGHGHGHGHGHGLVTKKKSHISETGRFNPLKSNSPLYKPHQKKPLQERNFFFLKKNSRNLSQLTLPYLGCRDSQGREDLRANLLLLYHFCHRVDTFRHQDYWILTTFGFGAHHGPAGHGRGHPGDGGDQGGDGFPNLFRSAPFLGSNILSSMDKMV